MKEQLESIREAARQELAKIESRAGWMPPACVFWAKRAS